MNTMGPYIDAPKWRTSHHAQPYGKNKPESETITLPKRSRPGYDGPLIVALGCIT